MKDNLEDFIRQNREAFDDKVPSEKVWQNIARGTSPQQQGGVWTSLTLWRAAAVIFMALSGYLLYQSNSSAKPANEASMASSVKEFTDVEAFYVQQISEKTELIDEFQRNDGVNGFTHDFQQLEAMYSVLKEEMKASPSEKVKDALVLNLLIRIDLLNQHLHKLEQQYSKDNKKDKSA